ncbi:MAG TPA: transglutaminase-like cysteine peptidase [Microvirga sp.]|nr:transglutaminase-like cysteine peptidase [Microvirga sp.]
MRQGHDRRSNPDGHSAGSGFIARLIRLALIGFPLIVAGAAGQAQTLASLPDAPQLAEKTGAARPILAWVKFCEQFAAECAIDPSEPAVVQLTSQTWNTIVSVNRRVNARIKPITDKEHWNLVDRWEFPDDGAGDCEDFQLLKRRMLVERGLPRRAMRMTVVIDELGEGHAVLMVRTDRGDYILDNKTSAVLPWDQTGYVFVKRESQESLGWVSLGGRSASPTTTANR